MRIKRKETANIISQVITVVLISSSEKNDLRANENRRTIGKTDIDGIKINKKQRIWHIKEEISSL